MQQRAGARHNTPVAGAGTSRPEGGEFCAERSHRHVQVTNHYPARGRPEDNHRVPVRMGNDSRQIGTCSCLPVCTDRALKAWRQGVEPSFCL